MPSSVSAFVDCSGVSWHRCHPYWLTSMRPFAASQASTHTDRRRSSHSGTYARPRSRRVRAFNIVQVEVGLWMTFDAMAWCGTSFHKVAMVMNIQFVCLVGVYNCKLSSTNRSFCNGPGGGGKPTAAVENSERRNNAHILVTWLASSLFESYRTYSVHVLCLALFRLLSLLLLLLLAIVPAINHTWVRMTNPLQSTVTVPERFKIHCIAKSDRNERMSCMSYIETQMNRSVLIATADKFYINVFFSR